MKFAVIGGGPMGLICANELLKCGHNVELFEKENVLGGMSASFDFSGIDMEMYYHGVYAPDNYTFELMKELDIFEKLNWTETKTGFYYDESLYKWGGPFELLSFPKQNFIDKIRYGFHLFFASKIKNWQKLDNTTALNWIKKYSGERNYLKFWDSLFNYKFYEFKELVATPWALQRLIRIAKSRKNIFKERMGYISGGTHILIDSLEHNIMKRGGVIYKNSAIEKIHLNENMGITIKGNFLPFENIISTIPIQYINKLTPELPYDDKNKLEKLDNLGVVCVILKLTEKMTDKFWLNISDHRMDIPGMIELSNLNTEIKENILYIPFYLHMNNPKYSEPDCVFIDKAKCYIQYINPKITEEKILDIRIFRYEYAQPLTTTSFLEKLPPIKSEKRKGFCFADTAYCYPEDRSIDGSIRIAKQIVRYAVE